MTSHHISADIADIHDTLPLIRAEVDRDFGLPPGLHLLMVDGFAAFLVVMAIGLPTRGLIIPLAICGIYLSMFFGVPALWMRMKPAHRSTGLDWAAFSLHGVETATGRISARDAAVQVLILPVMVLLWAIVTVTIAALV